MPRPRAPCTSSRTCRCGTRSSRRRASGSKTTGACGTLSFLGCYALFTLLHLCSRCAYHTRVSLLSSCSAVVISLKKKAPEYWDGLTKEKSLKKFIKVDFAKFCEEDDPEYTGDIAMSGEGQGMGGMPGMGMPGMGGMGGMDMASMMGGMGGMGGMDF